MQAFKRNHLQHALAVSHWMRRHGARGGIAPLNLAMEITLGEKTVRFHPQFTANTDSGMCFVNQLIPGINGFVGWYPYPAKGWPIAQDKLVFKQFARQCGLRTPAWSQTLAEVKGPFLVKRRVSSLGAGQRGPFLVRPPPYPLPDIRLTEGEYCEQFIAGQLLKAWYWNDTLAVVEVVNMPSVMTDGKSTVKALVQQLGKAGAELPADLLNLQDVTPATVPAAGQKLLVDYRYMADLNPALHADYNCRERIRGTPMEAQLQEAGCLCWGAVPSEARSPGAATTLDGIVDVQGRVWFLEANCNPLLHPAFYDAMLDQLFLDQQDA